MIEAEKEVLQVLKFSPLITTPVSILELFSFHGEISDDIFFKSTQLIKKAIFSGIAFKFHPVLLTVCSIILTNKEKESNCYYQNAKQFTEQ